VGKARPVSINVKAVPRAACDEIVGLERAELERRLAAAGFSLVASGKAAD
jgi:hypothetical protein